MRRLCIGVWMVVLVMAPGCPHTFRKGGAIDQEVLKNMTPQAIEEGCIEEDLWVDCVPELYDQCLAQCQKLIRSKKHP